MPTFELMPPSKDKKRNEVHFTAAEQKQFEALAKADGRSLKNWMETRLRELLPKQKSKS